MPPSFDASDEAFQPAGADPHWNESAWFHFSVPDRDLIGFVYFFHDVRTGVSGGGPAIWDPSGEEIYDCRFYDWRWNQPPDRSRDLRDLTLPNSLRHTMVEPFERYRLGYDALGLQLDLEWTALMPPHEITYSDASLMIGSRHFDQPGRITGTLALDGDRIEVDGWSLRDRTWGPHRPGARRSGDYLWAIAGPEEHWHAITAARAEEPGADEVVNGYLVRDGVLGELVSGRRVVAERRDGAPVRVLFDAVDDHGRELHAEGSVRTALRWMGWPGRLAYWTLTDWSWDGTRGWGEDQEFFPREAVRALRGS